MSQQVVKAIPQSCHNELQEGTITRPYAQAGLVCSHLQTPDPTLDPTLKGYTSLSSLELPLTPNKIKIKNICHEKSMPQRKNIDENVFKSGLTHQIRSVCNALQTSARTKAEMFDGGPLFWLSKGVFSSLAIIDHVNSHKHNHEHHCCCKQNITAVCVCWLPSRKRYTGR